MLRGVKAAALAASLALAATAAEAQVTPDNFVGGRTSDLAALCAAGAGDPNVIAAINHCHGFLMATGQFHTAVTDALPNRRPFFCLPNPRPTLESVRTGFVTWARANPQQAGTPAVEGVVRFATDAFPCPPQPAQSRRRAP